MGFRDEIIKEKRRLYPYLRYAASLSPGGWEGKEEYLYTLAEEGTYRYAMKGHVLSFGTFSRAVANSLFGLSIPGFSIDLMDPDRDWRTRADIPYDLLISKWLHILIRIFDNDGDIYDGTVAQGMITNVAFPPANRVTLQAQVSPPEQFNAVLPRRTITLDDWPGAPPESVGRPVPILYGLLSNAVKVYTPPPPGPGEPGGPPIPYPHPPECDCPVYVPPLYSSGKDNQAAYSVRWSDHFVDAPQGTVPPVGSGSYGNTDAWLQNNYHGIGDCRINTTGGLFGGPCVETVQGYGELTRGIGVQTAGHPDHLEEPPLTDRPRYGAPAGPHGACGMLRMGNPVQMLDLPVLFEVWASAFASNLGGLFGLQVWDYTNPGGPAVDAELYVNGVVKRPNGAYDSYWHEGYPHPPGEYPPEPNANTHWWATRHMLNCFVPNRWQWIEMQWKISSFTRPENLTTDNPATNADGWIKVHIDGIKVIHLQEIAFNYGFGSPATVGDTYWEGVAYRPSGKIACLYLSDRYYCNEAKPYVSPVPEDPCADAPNVSDSGVGAVPAILVDATSTTELRLTKVGGIEAPAQDNSAAPTNLIGYTGVPGAIAGGVTTWYKVTGVKGGKETSWASTGCDNALAHYDRLEWDQPPQGPMDSYRIYQTVTPDLSLHQDMGGVLREETYYVKTVAGTQAPGGRQAHGPSTHWVEWGAHGEGSPQQAAALKPFTTYINTYVVAGHACVQVQDVYAALTDLIPATPTSMALGGIDPMTAELIPITQGGVTSFYQETEPRMRRLAEGTDYTVQFVDKPSGAFTVLVVTRQMTSGRDCSFAAVTCNVSGIETDGDGTGELLADGIMQFAHFLLNYVFNDYRTGRWLWDVPSKPGLVDVNSFEAANALVKSWVGKGFIGARALLEQQDVRTLIQEAIVTFNLQFFYRNAIDNNAAAWAVNVFDTRQWDFSAGIDFTPENMVLDTFQTEITSDFLANVVNFAAGPNLGGSKEGEQTGWVVNGKLEDSASVSRTWGRRELDLPLPWTRDRDTASAVAGAYLDFRSYPAVVGSFQTMGRGLLVDVGGLVKITHPDGPGPGQGWENRNCIVVGHDHDLDSGLVTVKFMNTPGMIGSENAIPAGTIMVGGFGNSDAGPGCRFLSPDGHITYPPPAGWASEQDSVVAFCRTAEGHIGVMGGNGDQLWDSGIGLLKNSDLSVLSSADWAVPGQAAIGADAQGYWYTMKAKFPGGTSMQIARLDTDSDPVATWDIPIPAKFTNAYVWSMAVSEDGLIVYCWMNPSFLGGYPDYQQYTIHKFSLVGAGAYLGPLTADYSGGGGYNTLQVVPGSGDILIPFGNLNGTSGLNVLRRYTPSGTVVWTAGTPEGVDAFFAWNGIALGVPGDTHFLAWAYTGDDTSSGARYVWFDYATGTPDNDRNFAPDSGDGFYFDSQFVVLSERILLPATRRIIPASTAPSPPQKAGGQTKAGGSGWENRSCLVVGHDHDLDSGLVTIKFMSTPGMIGSISEPPPTTVIMVGGFGDGPDGDTGGVCAFLSEDGTHLDPLGDVVTGQGLAAFARLSPQGHIAQVGGSQPHFTDTGAGVWHGSDLTVLSTYNDAPDDRTDGQCVSADEDGWWYVSKLNTATNVGFTRLSAYSLELARWDITIPAGFSMWRSEAIAVSGDGLTAYRMMKLESGAEANRWRIHKFDLTGSGTYVGQFHSDWTGNIFGWGGLLCVPGTSDLLATWNRLNAPFPATGALKRYSASGTEMWTAGTPDGAGPLFWMSLALGLPGDTHFLAWAYDDSVDTDSGVRYCWFNYETGEPDNDRNFTPEDGEFEFDSQFVVLASPVPMRRRNARSSQRQRTLAEREARQAQRRQRP